MDTWILYAISISIIYFEAQIVLDLASGNTFKLALVSF